MPSGSSRPRRTGPPRCPVTIPPCGSPGSVPTTSRNAPEPMPTLAPIVASLTTASFFHRLARTSLYLWCGSAVIASPTGATIPQYVLATLSRNGLTSPSTTLNGAPNPRPVHPRRGGEQNNSVLGGVPLPGRVQVADEDVDVGGDLFQVPHLSGPDPRYGRRSIEGSRS